MVWEDFKKNKYAILILCICFMPLTLMGYSHYLLVLLTPMAFVHLRFSINGLLIFFFSLIYTLAINFRGEILTPSDTIFYCFYPILAFSVGKSISNKFLSLKSNIVLITILICCLAFPAIIYNLIDYFKTGELVNVQRKITYGSMARERSATGYGMMLSLVLGMAGLLFYKTNNSNDHFVKYASLIFSVLALFGTFRLVNRTGIVIAGVSSLIVFGCSRISARRLGYLLLVLMLLFAVWGINQNSELVKEVTANYEMRNDGEGSTNELGGRTDRWIRAIDQIYREPFGNKGLKFYTGYNYAHNLWLDVGIRGSIFSLVILLFITICFIKRIYHIWRDRMMPKFDLIVILLLSITFFLQFGTEPIIEGLPQLFWLWLFFWGMMDSIAAKYKKRSMRMIT